MSHMAKKSAADVAADLKNEQEKPTESTVTAEPTKGHVSKSTSKFIIQAFGVMNIPAAAGKAADADKVETHMYHACGEGKTGSLKQSYHCDACQAKVENAKNTALKGVEEKGKLVFLTQTEIDGQKPVSDKVLKITEFVPAEEINPIYYESTEYLWADKGGEKGFATLREGLAQTNRVAIGTIVSRGHQYTVAIRAYGQNGMVMSYLFAEYEIRECGKWKPVATVQAEVELVKQLMTETELAKEKFTAAGYDPFLRNIRGLIAKKAAGETVENTVCEEPTATGTDDLLNSLKAMLDQQNAKKAAAGK